MQLIWWRARAPTIRYKNDKLAINLQLDTFLFHRLLYCQGEFREDCKSADYRKSLYLAPDQSFECQEKVLLSEQSIRGNLIFEILYTQTHVNNVVHSTMSDMKGIHLYLSLCGIHVTM